MAPATALSDDTHRWRLIFRRAWLSSRPARYAMSIGVSVAAIALNSAVSQFVPNLRVVNLFPAVLLASLLGGVGPGLVATAITALAASYLWLPPAHSWWVADPADRLALAGYLLSGTLMSWLIEALHEMRFRAEQAERAVRAALEHAEAAVAELDRAVRFNETFVGILGHDLRNPLTGVKLAAQFGREHNDNPKLAKPLSRILRTSERMERLIRQLLDFSRIRLGKGIQIAPEQIDVASVVRDVIDEFDPAQPEGTLRFDRQGDTTVRGDADRLAQVFSNLIANALQHGAVDQGVRVLVDGSQADTASIEVRNMGVIAPSVLPTVFEPLAGGDQKPSNADGLGLGLFITRAIVEAHQGRIELRSDAETGTIVKVLLPRT
jgi:signal transduction histidine kinase